MDAPGNDGNASMPEQVKPPNPMEEVDDDDDDDYKDDDVLYKFFHLVGYTRKENDWALNGKNASCILSRNLCSCNVSCMKTWGSVCRRPELLS